MLTIRRKDLNSSILPIYLLFIILITNQFPCIHSFVILQNDQAENQFENILQIAFQQSMLHDLMHLDDLPSDNPEFQKSSQRRFCCMNPLSGRKRFVQNPAQQHSIIGCIDSINRL
ncbi:hypothetical protein I4U23_018421 [Adineta vaga]|nr:hypothetical protein I4U23_018421 [Adineta vaga]